MFFIQHGFGKSDKIDRLAETTQIAGVILSPAHEDAARLRETADRSRNLGLKVLLDPQSYIYSLAPQGTARHHAANGLEFGDMHWSQSAETLTSHVAAVQHSNARTGTDALISPSPFQGAFPDYWLSVSMQYARSSASSWGGNRTLVSLVVDESILRSWDHTQEWMDVLTTINCRGFYLLVNRRNQQYPAGAWDPVALTNLLRLIYTLAGLNVYELYWGYSDIDGLCGLSAGATGIASGWAYGLRGFSVAKWNEHRSGGAPPTPRVFTPSLWSPLRLTEANDLSSSPLGRSSLPLTLVHNLAERPMDSWSIVDAQLQHLAQLAYEADRVTSEPGLRERVESAIDSLLNAASILQELDSHGYTLDRRYAARVDSYLRAMEAFGESESL